MIIIIIIIIIITIIIIIIIIIIAAIERSESEALHESLSTRFLFSQWRLRPGRDIMGLQIKILRVNSVVK